ncbi:MAG: ATP-dependent DNA ligase, partial [Candidatus Kariarchaeaceae archaeon]
MILEGREQMTVKSEEDFQELISEIREVIQFTTKDSDLYYQIANSYKLPIHLSYLIIRSIETNENLELKDLSSVSYYAVCRDLLTPYKNKTFTFRNFYNIQYPYLKQTDERLQWFLKHENGLTLTQKIALLEEDTSFTSIGVGRGRLTQIIQRLNLAATPSEIEDRRLKQYDGNWAGAIASFIGKERGDLTAAELLKVADYMADDSGIKHKLQILTYLVSRMGKIEVYFLANQINRFHDRISRTSSLLRAISKAFDVEYKTIERLVSMHSMVDLAKLIQDNKVLEQFEKIIPFRSFRPMLAAKWEQQYKFPLYAEAKFDGVRLLVHKLGNRIACFSRRRKNYNYKYGMISELMQYIPAYSAIIDGEIIATQWTPTGLRHLTVYELHEAVKEDNPSVQLTYVIFDILYLNGQELTEFP